MNHAPANKKALIVGGGIAGPVTAVALQRAGIDSVVYEAYDTSAGLDAGAFLTVAVNGLDALRTLDAHEPVLGAGFPTGNIEFFSGTGKRLGEVPIGGALPDGTVTHTIKRANLYRALHDERRSGAASASNTANASSRPRLHRTASSTGSKMAPRPPEICSSAPTGSTRVPAGSSTRPRPSPATPAWATSADLPATPRSTPSRDRTGSAGTTG